MKYYNVALTLYVVMIGLLWGMGLNQYSFVLSTLLIITVTMSNFPRGLVAFRVSSRLRSLPDNEQLIKTKLMDTILIVMATVVVDFLLLLLMVLGKTNYGHEIALIILFKIQLIMLVVVSVITVALMKIKQS